VKKILCTFLSAIVIISAAACNKTPAEPELATDTDVYTETTIENPPDTIIGINFADDTLYVFGSNDSIVTNDEGETLANFDFVINSYNADGTFIESKTVAKRENTAPRGTAPKEFSSMFTEAFPATDGFLLLREDVTPLAGYGNFDFACALVPLTFDGVFGVERDFTENYREIEAKGTPLDNISIENGEILINEGDISVFNVSPDRRIELIETYSPVDLVYTKSITIYTKIPPEELAKRTVIKLGGIRLLDNDIAMIKAFNAQSSEYVVEFVDYGDDVELGNDYTLSSLTSEGDSFYAALMSGDIPDLVLSGGNDRFLTDKGLIADLNLLMDSDPEFNRADYFENIFEANEKGGNLYSISPYIMPSAVAAKSNLSILESDSFVNVWDVIGENYSLFVDEENGVCHFDTPEFIELLELSKKYYVSYEMREANEGDLATRIAAENKAKLDFRYGKSLMRNIYFDFSGYIENKYVLFSGETPKPVGYPGGSGGIATGFGRIMIFEDAPNKAGAWAFVKFVLSEKYQDTIGGFYTPVRRSSFDKSAEAFIRRSAPYEVDLGGEIITVPKASEADIAEIRGFIESIDRINRSNVYLMVIIEEETGAFYAGDKTAAETAKLIQNRMTVFVSE
jgi:ABC-type glycerol-3-phosphate transport system substrate-binding protein